MARPTYDAAMERRLDMSIVYNCHPDCPHMYECIVCGMRCKPGVVPNFAQMEEEIEKMEAKVGDGAGPE